tara:strand:+ start:14233 stop:17730 length:3498 start_codon:yes stop_codon:yes gene_type:complete
MNVLGRENFTARFKTLIVGSVLGIGVSIAAVMLQAPPCAEAAGTCPVGSTSTFSGDIGIQSGTAYTTSVSASSMTADRTITFPDADTTVVGTDVTQTLTNKTFTTPVFTSGGFTLKQAGGDYTIAWVNPTAGRAYTIPDSGVSTSNFLLDNATQTLTNKTIDGNSNTITNVTASSVPASALTGTTLASNVVNSSLTSVGTLTSLLTSGAIQYSGTAGTGLIVERTGAGNNNVYIRFKNDNNTGGYVGYESEKLAFKADDQYVAYFDDTLIDLKKNTEITGTLDVANGSTYTVTGDFLAKIQQNTNTTGKNGLSVMNAWANTDSIIFEVAMGWNGSTEGYYPVYTVDGLGQNIWKTSSPQVERMKLDSNGYLDIHNSVAIGNGGATPGANVAVLVDHDVTSGYPRLAALGNNQSTLTANTGNTEWLQVYPGSTVLGAGQTITHVTTASFYEPDIIGTGTLSNFAATVYIANAPDEHPSGKNYALYVDAGDVRIDQDLMVGPGVPGERLHVYSTSGNLTARIQSLGDNASLALWANSGGTGTGMNQDPRIEWKSGSNVRYYTYFAEDQGGFKFDDGCCTNDAHMFIQQAQNSTTLSHKIGMGTQAYYLSTDTSLLAYSHVTMAACTRECDSGTYPVSGYGVDTGGTNSSDATLYLRDHNGGVGSGGMLYFGTNMGYKSPMAFIRGYILDGTNNTKGELVFGTRSDVNSSTVPARLVITHNGNLALGERDDGVNGYRRFSVFNYSTDSTADSSLISLVTRRNDGTSSYAVDLFKRATGEVTMTNYDPDGYIRFGTGGHSNMLYLASNSNVAIGKMSNVDGRFEVYSTTAPHHALDGSWTVAQFAKPYITQQSGFGIVTGAYRWGFVPDASACSTACYKTFMIYNNGDVAITDNTNSAIETAPTEALTIIHDDPTIFLRQTNDNDGESGTIAFGENNNSHQVSLTYDGASNYFRLKTYTTSLTTALQINRATQDFYYYGPTMQHKGDVNGTVWQLIENEGNTNADHAKLVIKVEGTSNSSDTYITFEDGNGVAASTYWTVGVENTQNEFTLDNTSSLGAATPVQKWDVSGDSELEGTLSQGSDLRFKTNVQGITGALDLIKQVDGVLYDRISDGKSMYGFVAQDLELVVPELVKTNSDEYKSVRYSNMVPILVEAIKELEERVAALENQ